MDLDPIKQLQSLLKDRGQVLEKISSIHSALGSLRTDSAAPGPESPPATSAQSLTTANPFFELHTDDRLLQSLREMQAQIEERVRPLAQQVVESEVARLREQSVNQQALLNSCLQKIDQCILNCIGQINDYQNTHAVLIALNERIANLGGTPEPLPESLLPENYSAALRARVDTVRDRGKL
jgi:hypothetical protein